MLGPPAPFDDHKVDAFVKNFEAFLSMDETCTPDSVPHQPAHLDHVRASNGSKRMDDGGSDSDSGDEESVLEVASGRLPIQNNNGSVVRPAAPLQDDDSSSGEEQSEDELVISASRSNMNGLEEGHVVNSERRSESGSNISPIPSRSSQQGLEAKTWWKSDLQTNRICNRFFGSNKALVHEMIGNALSNRLGEKVKQNSSLVSTLPHFTAVPQVRGLAASQLEKWLQSPALSGLARTLFSKLVGEIENVDPPLPEDVSTIKCIMSMSLKTNQVSITF